MEKITKVTEADVGRIAVSQDGYYRIQILEAQDNNSKVKFLKDTPSRKIGQTSSGFGLIGGMREMYWEEPKLIKGVWLQTAPAIEEYGEQAVNEVLKVAYEIADKSSCWETFEDYMKNWSHTHNYSDSCVGIDYKGKFNGWDTLEILKMDEEILSFEEFTDRLGIAIKKQNKPKPRFHKPRKKPPVRKKTDVTVSYKTGESYTLKDVIAFAVDDKTTITTESCVSSGIIESGVVNIQTSLIQEVVIKSPQGEYLIYCNMGNLSVEFPDGFTYCKSWRMYFPKKSNK